MNLRVRGPWVWIVACSVLVVVACAYLVNAPDSRRGSVPNASSVPSGSPIPKSQHSATEPSTDNSGWIPSDFGRRLRKKTRELHATVAVGLSDLAGGDPRQFGSGPIPYAYSTIKVPIVATALRLDSSPTESQLADMDAAITKSDNAAARSVYNQIVEMVGTEDAATAAIEDTLALGGDSDTSVPTAAEIPNWHARQAVGVVSTYGQTLWSVSDQAQFMARLYSGCVLPKESTRKLRVWLSHISVGQRWGLGQLPSTSAFKGGWGQDEVGHNYYVRQVALMTPTAGGPYVMSVSLRLKDASRLGSGSIVRESDAIEELGRWVTQELGPAPEQGACA